MATHTHICSVDEGGTDEKPAPRQAIMVTGKHLLQSSEQQSTRDECVSIGPTRINLVPCLFSQVVKDWPFHWPVSVGFSISNAIEVFNASEAGTENSLSAPVSLLECQDVTGDRWDRGAKGTRQLGRKHGAMEGLRGSGDTRPLTHLDSEPLGLIKSLRKHPVRTRGMSLGETPAPAKSRGPSVFILRSEGMQRRAGVKSCTSDTQGEPGVCELLPESPGFCCFLLFRVGGPPRPAPKVPYTLSAFYLHCISSNFPLVWKRILCVALTSV